MVFRLPIQSIAMIIGLILCIYSFHDDPRTQVNQAINEFSSANILIIDPGHGGLDGGAVSADGKKESDINLCISLKLNALSHLYGVTTAMTRTSDDIPYPQSANTISACKKADQQMRLSLIRDCPNAILYSIHQNYFPHSQVSGAQVLYGHDETSRKLGQFLQVELCRYLCPDCRRVASEVDESIYLMKHCECTSVLVECGFLSNPSEAKRLQNNEYQTKIAAILLYTYLQFTY